LLIELNQCYRQFSKDENSIAQALKNGSEVSGLMVAIHIAVELSE
jgi:hypothetical protein